MESVCQHLTPVPRQRRPNWSCVQRNARLCLVLCRITGVNCGTVYRAVSWEARFVTGWNIKGTFSPFSIPLRFDTCDRGILPFPTAQLILRSRNARLRSCVWFDPGTNRSENFALKCICNLPFRVAFSTFFPKHTYRNRSKASKSSDRLSTQMRKIHIGRNF